MPPIKTIPKVRSENIVVQDLGNEILIYDLKVDKAFCLNEVSKIVWQACDGRQTISEIIEDVGFKLNSPPNEDLVWFALNQLNKENLLENGENLPNHFAGMSRREVIKKIGLGTMMALPIVASMVAPTSFHAASLVCNTTPGMTCTCTFMNAAARMTGICGNPGVGGIENVSTCNAPTANCDCNITNITNPNCTGGNTICTGMCA